jgi:predicted methyltransferase
MPRILLILCALILAGCSRQSGAPGDTAPASADGPVETAVSIYQDALQNPARPESDRARDADRKPAEVLEFLGVMPGMTVLDMFSGGGYYTEILSSVVGDSGRVIAHSNQAYLNFAGGEFEMRYLGGRLPNVQVLMAENNELSLNPASYDAVILVLSFHDLYYSAPESGWPTFDVPAFLEELHKGLKDDGFVGVVDHYASAGAGSESGNTLHRIDPAIVIDNMVAAGFLLDAQSDMLRNSNDDYDKTVFDPDVRGKTDRFVLRFRKSD